MGKSTTAKLFAEEGVPVHDADAAVHRLYEGEATPLIEAAFPGTTAGGKVDRAKLGQRVLGDAAAIKRLEEIVHPLVRRRASAISRRSRAQRRAGRGARHSAAVRDRRRGALRRGGGGVGAGRGAARARLRAPRHDRGKLAAILAKQMPDAEKRARADFVVDTSQGFDAARAQVRDILARLLRCRNGDRDSAGRLSGIRMREIVLDTETTGLDPNQGHRLVEIGCIELVNRIPTGATFHRYLNPERDMPAEAFAIHGLSTEFLKRTSRFCRNRRRFPRLHRRRAAGDPQRQLRPRLSQCRAQARRAPLIARDRLVDTLLLARRKHPAGPNRSTICARATASTIRAAPSTARCSTPRSWPRSIWN